MVLSISVAAQTYSIGTTSVNVDSRFAVINAANAKTNETFHTEISRKPAKYYTELSHRPYQFSSNLPHKFYDYTQHSSGESIKSSHWTEITSVTKVIDMSSTKNEIHLTLGGGYQINNKEILVEPILSTVGFFIDDKLVDVKPLFLDASSTCASNLFTVSTTFNNLSQGKHTVKFALRNIETPETSGLTFTYGGSPRSANCKLVSAPTIPLKASILVNEL